MWRHTSLATLTITLIVLAGCTPSLPRTAPPRIEPLPILSRDRWMPGEKSMASLEETAKKDLCLSAQSEGTVFLEAAEVTPGALLPGEKLYHRLRYVLCPAASALPVSGKIVRTVRLRKVKIFTDVTEHAFKPGSWVVDAAVIVPEDARSGKYTFDVALTVGKHTVKRSNTFVVRKSK